jgi:hypothetical protein
MNLHVIIEIVFEIKRFFAGQAFKVLAAVFVVLLDVSF